MNIQETKIDGIDGFMDLRKSFLRELIDEHEREYCDGIRDFYFDNSNPNDPATYGMSWGDFLI